LKLLRTVTCIGKSEAEEELNQFKGGGDVSSGVEIQLTQTSEIHPRRSTRKCFCVQPCEQ
jgi:hypothetical protein